MSRNCFLAATSLPEGGSATWVDSQEAGWPEGGPPGLCAGTLTPRPVWGSPAGPGGWGKGLSESVLLVKEEAVLGTSQTGCGPWEEQGANNFRCLGQEVGWASLGRAAHWTEHNRVDGPHGGPGATWSPGLPRASGQGPGK